jgi:hypothetical protein
MQTTEKDIGNSMNDPSVLTFEEYKEYARGFGIIDNFELEM